MNKFFRLNLCSVVFICCMINTFLAAAQSRDSLINVYNNQTLHTSGNSFIKGSRQLEFGELKAEFTSPYTMPLYKRAKADVRLTWLCSGSAIAALVTSVVIRKNNSSAANVLSIAAIGLNLGAIHFRKRSSELVDEAIWQRNKEILFNVLH